jgi:opacity protein-like surface antigen
MKHVVLFSVVCLLLSSISIQAGEHSIGAGFHYFYTLDDISNEFDDSIVTAFKRDGVGINFSYRYKFNRYVGVLAELQLYPNGHLDAKTVVSPRLFALLGKSVYGGIGVGWNNVQWRDETNELHVSGNWTDPFYMLRGGIEFPLLMGRFILDVNANYDFNYWNDVQAFDSDILTFGAGLKIVL